MINAMAYAVWGVLLFACAYVAGYYRRRMLTAMGLVDFYERVVAFEAEQRRVMAREVFDQHQAIDKATASLRRELDLAIARHATYEQQLADVRLELTTVREAMLSAREEREYWRERFDDLIAQGAKEERRRA